MRERLPYMIGFIVCKFANRFRKLMTLFANFAVGTTSFELRICKIVTFFWSFSRWTSSECVRFFAFFRRKCSIFPQNFLGGLRPPNPPNVANFHLRIHAEFSKPRDTFQNAENEGSFFMSKPRNGPNRGMFITVFSFSLFMMHQKHTSKTCVANGIWPW